MSWFVVDDGFYAHPKVVACCSLEALGLWTKCGSWAKRYVVDGALTLSTVRMLGGSEKLADELVRVGLWERAAGGWQFHDWTQYQGSRVEILAKRAADAARKANALRPDSTRKARGVQLTDELDSGRTARGVQASSPSPSPSLSPSLDPAQEDLTQPPPLPTLTTNAHAHARVENGNGGGFGDERAPAVRDDEHAEHEAFRWLHTILHDTVTQSAPRVGGRWRAAYAYISAQPAAEWLRVEACLRAELVSRRLKPRYCTPGHVADYWADYAAGEPPGGGNGQRSSKGASEVGTAEEFAREELAERRPAWAEDI